MNKSLLITEGARSAGQDAGLWEVLTRDNYHFTVRAMIRGFRHRGLRRLYQDDDHRELNRQHVERITRILARLEEAQWASDLDLPGFRLHQLRGDLAGYWSITVRASWRITFRFVEGEVTDVDLVDYH